MLQVPHFSKQTSFFLMHLDHCSRLLQSMREKEKGFGPRDKPCIHCFIQFQVQLLPHAAYLCNHLQTPCCDTTLFPSCTDILIFISQPDTHLVHRKQITVLCSSYEFDDNNALSRSNQHNVRGRGGHVHCPMPNQQCCQR